MADFLKFYFIKKRWNIYWWSTTRKKVGTATGRGPFWATRQFFYDKISKFEREFKFWKKNSNFEPVHTEPTSNHHWVASSIQKANARVLDTIIKIKIAQLTYRVYHCLGLFEICAVLVLAQLVLLKFMTCQVGCLCIYGTHTCITYVSGQTNCPYIRVIRVRGSRVTNIIVLLFHVIPCVIKFNAYPPY